MTKLDLVTATAYWPERVEDRAACAARFARLLRGVISARPAAAGPLVLDSERKPLDPFSVEEISAALRQMQREDGAGPLPQFGWRVSWMFPDGDTRFTRLDGGCGGWTLGNSVHVEIGMKFREDFNMCKAIAIALAESFDPTFVSVNSSGAAIRHHELKRPFPIVDWIVYHEKMIIPPAALPMVHSVEQIGTGTLVVMQAKRPKADNPDDLALIDTAYPIISSYFPEAPKPNQTEHRSLQ